MKNRILPALSRFSLLLIFLISTNLDGLEGQRPDFSFSFNLANNLREVFSNASIEREAASRIARQKAEEELARLNAQKEAILKERIEALRNLAKGVWWLASNGTRLVWNGFKFVIETGKDTCNTTYEFLDDAESVVKKLNACDKRAIRGSIGFAVIITGIIWYKLYKNKQPNQRPANDNDYENPPAYNPYLNPNAEGQ